MSTKFNLPIAQTLDQADARTIDIFRLISEELTACEKRAKEKQNGNT
jgi:hypothetical protein|tara:strand:+ start:953 stop:1093 length:141 start_codon:yes stop_codon:yes gene_type:complete